VILWADTNTLRARESARGQSGVVTSLVVCAIPAMRDDVQSRQGARYCPTFWPFLLLPESYRFAILLQKFLLHAPNGPTRLIHHAVPSQRSVGRKSRWGYWGLAAWAMSLWYGMP